MIGWVY